MGRSSQISYAGTGVPAPSASLRERELWDRAVALMDFFWTYEASGDADVLETECKALSSSSDSEGEKEESKDAKHTSPSPLTVDWYVVKEAHRFPCDSGDGPDATWMTRRDLVHLAAPFVRWAKKITKETNPQVIARFAVETAYDHLCRAKIGYALANPRPLRWRWDIDSSSKMTQTMYPTMIDKAAPIRSDDFGAFQKLKPSLGPWGEGKNIVEPVVGKMTDLRVFDPLRPPVAALRLAAHLIEDHLGPTKKEVCAVELGHSFGPQAFSVWLPHQEVHTASSVIEPDQMSREVERALTLLSPSKDIGAVVINIPSRRAIDYVAAALNPDVLLDRRLNNHLWSAPIKDPCAHVEGIVELGLKVARGASLIVLMGDIEHGLHHVANEVIHKSGKFEPMVFTHKGKVIDTVEEPAVVVRQRGEWPKYGVLSPSNRMVSAWKRHK